MSVTAMRELLTHELGDLLYAEKQILKSLPKMAKEVRDPELNARLLQHRRETEEQVRNLEQAFEAMGERAKAHRCDGILGILEEHRAFKSDESPSKAMLEAFDLGAGLRVEHYEIAAYRSAVVLAKTQGLPEVARLLQANLAQEEAMAKFLTGAAPAALRQLDAQALSEQEDSGDGAVRKSARKPARRKTVARKAARARKRTASR